MARRRKKTQEIPEEPEDPPAAPDGISVRLLMEENDDCPFLDWRDGLRDRTAQARIAKRIVRVARDGSFGDHRERVNGAVSELRIDYGPSYRVYYVQVGNVIVVLSHACMRWAAEQKERRSDNRRILRRRWRSGRRTKMRTIDFRDVLANDLKDPEFRREFVVAFYEEDGIKGVHDALDEIARADAVNKANPAVKFSATKDAGNLDALRAALKSLGLDLDVVRITPKDEELTLQMDKTAEEVSAILHQYLGDVYIDDRSPDAEPIRVLLDEGSVRRDAYSWKATVRSSRMPRRWSYLYEEIGIVTEELLAKAGLNVFFTVDDPAESDALVTDPA